MEHVSWHCCVFLPLQKCTYKVLSLSVSKVATVASVNIFFVVLFEVFTVVS